MNPEMKILDDMDRMTYDFLWTNLSGIDDEELDWRPHPNGNPVRWIVGHLLWYAVRASTPASSVSSRSGSRPGP
jgi:hypothetical protein